MARLGHYRDRDGRSAFRVFAPGKARLAVVLPERGERIELAADAIGYWRGDTDHLPAGTLYLIEVDGRLLPDPASRGQPRGVHGPSMVADVQPATTQNWRGVAIEDAIVYELHVGTFTPEGTRAAARDRLAYLYELGITVVELMPLAAFPGERNWGYDGVYLFALHEAYGSYADLKAFIEAAHGFGIAVLLDVVYNHFGPEGNYSGAFAPYTQAAATPWGAALNFDGAYNHGVRALFLENARYWLVEIGFDGFRMDAVQMIADNSPVHILRQITDLARGVAMSEGRHVLMIAEHLRNDRNVTHPRGFHFHSQWSDDLNYALFAYLTGETGRHYANFGAFDDIVAALTRGFVLDGTRFDRHYRFFVGTNGAATEGAEHVVHIQNHDQVGNRPHGDRMITTYGHDKALLAITAVFASPYVPMLWMGEEYGETAPFLFFEDFSDPRVIDGVRTGRGADYAFGATEAPDPHARATFEASKLRWERRDSAEGHAILDYYRKLIALKRSGALGPRRRRDVRVTADAEMEVITIETETTCTVLNFAAEHRPLPQRAGWSPAVRSGPEGDAARLAPFEAVILMVS
jgi:maltooligosyltrehalose trehalohydrolase